MVKGKENVARRRHLGSWAFREIHTSSSTGNPKFSLAAPFASIVSPVHPRNRHRSASAPALSLTTKQAGCSSIDHGGGKRRWGLFGRRFYDRRHKFSRCLINQRASLVHLILIKFPTDRKSIIQQPP